MVEITDLLSKSIWEIKSQTEHHISIWFLPVFFLIGQKNLKSKLLHTSVGKIKGIKISQDIVLPQTLFGLNHVLETLVSYKFDRIFVK